MRAILSYRCSAPPSESPLERRFLQLLKARGLPLPLSQFEVLEASELVARLDFAYPALKIGIECDGFRFHFGRNAWINDAHRSNKLARLGWLILRFTANDLQGDGVNVIGEVRAAVDSRDPQLSMFARTATE